MSNDDPTLPHIDWSDPDGPARPDMPFRASGPQARPEDFSRSPTWPIEDWRSRLQPHQRTAGDRQAGRRQISPLVLGASLGANFVLLLCVLTLLLFGHTIFASGGPTVGQTNGGAGASGTATVSPSPSVTPVSGWLQVSPVSVQLGCGDGQREQVVVLQNTGPTKVHWQATFSLSQDQAGVSISPQHGSLDSGDSTQVQIQNTTQASDGQTAPGTQGAITFTPTSQSAGQPANLSYTTQACN